MRHIEDGVPKVPDWKEVLLNHERRSGVELGTIDEESKEVLEQKILEHLGQIKFETQGGRVAADHEVKLCGSIVKIPVLRLDIGDQEGLISEELLEKLNKTPKQRRAEASEFNSRYNDHRDLRRKAQRVLGRGARLKNALTKFNAQLLEQIDKQLMKFTRQEVFKQLRFMVSANNGKKVRKIKKSTGHEALKGKKITMKIRDKKKE